MSKINVGDVVSPIDPKHKLKCGPDNYAQAIVVGFSPLTLVSLDAKMKWTDPFKPGKLKTDRPATPAEIKLAETRM